MLLLRLIYKLNLIIGMYAWEQAYCDIGFGTIQGFGHPLGSWDVAPYK